MFVLRHRWRLGLFAALLAFAPQVLFGGAVPEGAMRPTPAARLAALLADPAAICHADPATGPADHSGHHDHGPACLICPLCAAIAAPALPEGQAPVLPLRRGGIVVAARAPPAPLDLPPALRLAASPRGPPVLV